MKKILLAALVAALATPAFAEQGVAPGGRVVSGASLIAAGTCDLNKPKTDGTILINTDGMATLGVDVSNTWVGTLAFSVVIDGGTSFQSFPGFSLSTWASSTTTTANGRFIIAVAGTRFACVSFSAFTSGTATVTLYADPSPAFAIMLGKDANGTLQVLASGTLGYQNDAVTTVTQIKATAGVIYEISATNTTAATAYVQVFCKPSASVTLGTTAPDYVVRLKTNAGAGDERDIPFPAGLCSAGTGLSVAGTTTATGAVTAAVAVMASYQ